MTEALTASGASIVRLVRSAPQSTSEIRWNPGSTLDPAAVSGLDAVLHLAGQSIVGRWSAARKAAIRDSRVLGTTTLSDALSRTNQPPRVLVTASAVGYYGDRGDELLREESSAGTGFLADTCREWEASSAPAEAAGIRVVRARFGIVLSNKGGALDKMLLPFKLGLGGRIGNGQQWMSWIHVADIVGAIQHILANPAMRGAVNLVAPNPATNAEFTRALGKALSRPTIFPLPAFAARLAFGEMANAALLASQRVEPAKLVANGYTFQFPELSGALKDLLG